MTRHPHNARPDRPQGQDRAAGGAGAGYSPTRAGTPWRGPLLAAVLGAAVLAATLTGCGPASTPDSGKKPTGSPGAKSPSPKRPFAPPILEQAWKSAPVTGDLLRTRLLGSWRTDTALYVGRGTGITVLDPVTGKQLGTIEPPEPGMSPCGMSDGLSKDGLGALAWLKGDPDSAKATCDHITLIDTRNGNTARWTATVSAEPLGGKPLTDDTHPHRLHR
ncbi:hypothetical protein ACWC98_37525 [Streptomyces goshikiensis]